MSSPIRFERDADGVALLTIDVPGRPMNVFTPAFSAALADAAGQIARREDVRGAVITSGKSSGFMAGADLQDLVDFHGRGGSAIEAIEAVGPGARALRALERCGKPVAAAINGVALGGGFELALACHHRVLLDEARAVVGLPEVTVGLLSAGGGTQRLPRLIGIARALPLLLGGRHVAPAEALDLGMVDALASASELVPAAREWVLAHPQGGRQPWDAKGFRLPGGAGALAPHATESFGATLARVRRDTQDNEPAPLAILSAVYEGTQLPIDSALAVEAMHFGPLLAGPAGPAQPAAPSQAARIGERLLSLLALEAVRCLEEGVVADAVEADLGAVLGLGYPDWTGGALSYIETVGLPAFVARCDALAQGCGERYRPTAGLRQRAQAGTRFYQEQ